MRRRAAQFTPSIHTRYLFVARAVCRRDKWLVLDLGSKCTVTSISLLGEVNTFRPARVLLDSAHTAGGPWQRVTQFCGLGALKWQRINLTTKPARFFRIYIRREGHATFRHAIHGVAFTCLEE